VTLAAWINFVEDAMPSRRPRQQETTTSQPSERASEQKPPNPGGSGGRSPVSQDDRLIGIERMPRKGDDE
jgi:hypothetical protein